MEEISRLFDRDKSLIRQQDSAISKCQFQISNLFRRRREFFLTQVNTDFV